MSRRRTLPQPVKIANGTWTVRWRGREGDRERRYRRTFRSRAEAVAFVRDEWAGNPDRAWRAAEVPFSQYADAWLKTVQPTVKAKTFEGYAQGLGHARRFFGDEPVGDITPRRAREFIAHLNATPTLRAARSIRATFAMFRAVMALAVEDEAIRVNPAVVVAGRLPQPSTHRSAEGHVVPTFSAKPPTAADVARVVDRLAADGRAPYDLMVDLLLHTGLRAGELAGLEVRDVRLWLGRDTWRGSLRVERTKRKVRGGWAIDTPKSKRSTRTVSVPTQVAAALHDYLATAHPRATEPEAPLFPNRARGGGAYDEATGRFLPRSAPALDWTEPVEPRAFYRNVYVPTLLGVGLPKSRLHDLRHAFARTYLAAGGDIHRLSEQMGHGSYRITYDVYAEWIPSVDDEPNPLDVNPTGSSQHVVRNLLTRL